MPTPDPPTPTHEEIASNLRGKLSWWRDVASLPKSELAALLDYVASAESTAAELLKAQQQLDAFCEAAGGAQTPEDAVRWCALKRERIAELEALFQGTHGCHWSWVAKHDEHVRRIAELERESAELRKSACEDNASWAREGGHRVECECGQHQTGEL